MSIDIKKEMMLRFDAARTAFHDDRRHSLATLHRWRLNGVRGVRLETCLIGGLRYTSKEAICRFISAQNADEQPVAEITPAQRRRQSEAARLALKAAGV